MQIGISQSVNVSSITYRCLSSDEEREMRMMRAVFMGAMLENGHDDVHVLWQTTLRP